PLVDLVGAALGPRGVHADTKHFRLGRVPVLVQLERDAGRAPDAALDRVAALLEPGDAPVVVDREPLLERDDDRDDLLAVELEGSSEPLAVGDGLEADE